MDTGEPGEFDDSVSDECGLRRVFIGHRGIGRFFRVPCSESVRSRGFLTAEIDRSEAYAEVVGEKEPDALHDSSEAEILEGVFGSSKCSLDDFEDDMENCDRVRARLCF